MASVERTDTAPIITDDALANAVAEAANKAGVRRYFTIPGRDPFDEVEWETRDALIPGKNASAGERHVFPQIGLSLLIIYESFELRCNGAFAALWSQAQVHLVEQATTCRHCERGDKALGETRIIDHDIKAAGAGALAEILVEIIDHHEIEV